MAKSPRNHTQGKTGLKGVSVALTGASGKLGGVLLERLLADRAIGTVLVFDLAAPDLSHAKLRFQPLDLTASSADRVIADALKAHEVEAVAHLPLLTAPDDPAYAHEVEAIGTMRVLAGLGQSEATRLVMASTTSVYGASPANPNHLDESRPLHVPSGSRYLRDKVEMERQVAAFRSAHADRVVTVLRFPPILGPEVYDPFAFYLARAFAPVVAGYDPLVQLVHVDDALQAIARVLTEPFPGDYNVGSRGVLPLSAVLEKAGVHRIPLPYVAARAAVRVTNLLGLTRMPPALLDFVRYLCVADLRRAEGAGLGGRYTIHDALQAFARARAV